MKRFGYFIVTFLEILFLAGAYIIQYFTRRKMGMARYVIYKNQGWERSFPMETLKYTAVTALIVITLLLLALLILRWKQQRRLVIAIHTGMLMLTTLYAVYTCISSTATMRAYYFISLMFGIAALLQIIKAGAALIMCRREQG